MCAGAATTTIYPTTEARDAAFILNDSGSKVLIAEDATQVAKIADADLPTSPTWCDQWYGRGQGPRTDAGRAGGEGQRGAGRGPRAGDPYVGRRPPDHLATIMYTSGTTGTPKGVELLHGGWCWQGVAQGELGILLPNDLEYLWLPLSHSFGKTILRRDPRRPARPTSTAASTSSSSSCRRSSPTIMCARRASSRSSTTDHLPHQGRGRRQVEDLPVGRSRSVGRTTRCSCRARRAAGFKVNLADRLVFSKIGPASAAASGCSSRAPPR
jgi:long-subunit acyl-CoA synthetase (AMP-forming)